ncbi:MAG: DNA cytosine methyltransferase [Eubacteriales bacterium]
MKKYNFIDLFAGCGGLSEGFYATGFNALAHIEINKVACETLKTRMRYYQYSDEEIEKSVLNLDITSDNIVKEIDSAVGINKVDVIIGGPPCQAYSSLGRAKDENAMVNDPRNYLFESYVKVLNYYRPKLFVFENVMGMLTAKVNDELIVNKIIETLSENYKVKLEAKLNVLNSVNYGVPQTRKRVIIIGVRNDLNIEIEDIYNNILKTHYSPETPNKDLGELKKYVTVGDAIKELPKLRAGEGQKTVEFKSTKVNEFLEKIAKDSTTLNDHVVRRHNDMDIKRYQAMAGNKWTFKELLAHRSDLKHEKPRVFGNSYTVQWWDLPSKTIIAHLYKDGNQFIHPDAGQARTFTVREAARLQSFPDDFVFEGSRTEQYKQIGNAVPPLMAEAIASAVRKTLEDMEK